MANVHGEFLEFNQEVKLPDSKRQSLRLSRKNLRNKIRSFFKEKGSIYSPRFYGQGSFMMDTIITPLDGDYDIDDGVYFTVKSKPSESVATFHKWIYDAVDGYTDKHQDKKNCIRVIFSLGHHIDLPIYYIIEDKYYNSHPQLAHKIKGWIESDPREFIEWFENKVDIHGEQLRRLVRYIKAWKDYKKGDMPSGLVLTILVANNIVTDFRDDVALIKTLENIYNKLSYSFVCYRPTTPNYENLLSNYSLTNQEYLLTSLKSIIDSGKKAIDNNTSRNDAIVCWRKHFGDRFAKQYLAEKEVQAQNLISSLGKGLTVGSSSLGFNKPNEVYPTKFYGDKDYKK